MRLIDADALEKEYRRQFEAVYKNVRDAVIPQDYYIERKAAYDKEIVRRDMEAFCEFLQSRPTIDATPRWVSVDERMPERGQVIVYCPDPDRPVRAAWTNGRVWRDEFGHPIGLPVTHWMPLPEPPKED